MLQYYDRDLVLQYKTRDLETTMEVVDEDTFTAATGEFFPCCLNFGSAISPGGGYKSVVDLLMPIKNQEEDLFRRSSLPETMDTEEVRKNYPLEDVECFHCECVVKKDVSLNEIYSFVVGVITMPAVIEPKPYEQALVRRKIHRILEVAAELQYDTLILGAWGCGVFGNDPRFIAANFKEMITSDFKGCFRKVIFAIPNEESTNHKIFKEVLDKNYYGE